MKVMSWQLENHVKCFSNNYAYLNSIQFQWTSKCIENNWNDIHLTFEDDVHITYKMELENFDWNKISQNRRKNNIYERLNEFSLIFTMKGSDGRFWDSLFWKRTTKCDVHAWVFIHATTPILSLWSCMIHVMI